MKPTSTKKLLLILKVTSVLTALITFMVIANGCRRSGCMNPCSTNYDNRAQKDNGNCIACTDPNAVNYCPGANVDDGFCTYQRTFWDDYNGTGWIDLWVADTDTGSFTFIYEGRIDSFYRNNIIPDCDTSIGTVTVIRPAGQYEIEYENEQGNIINGKVLFRPEGCRLFEINH